MTDQEHADNVLKKAEALTEAMNNAIRDGLNVSLPGWMVENVFTQREDRPVRYLLRELGVARNLIP